MNNQSSIKMTNEGLEVRNDIGELIALISSDNGEIEVFNGKSYVNPKDDKNKVHLSDTLSISDRGISTYIEKPKKNIKQIIKQISKIIFSLTRLALTIFITVKQYKSYKETI